MESLSIERESKSLGGLFEAANVVVGQKRDLFQIRKLLEAVWFEVHSLAGTEDVVIERTRQEKQFT